MAKARRWAGPLMGSWTGVRFSIHVVHFEHLKCPLLRLRVAPAEKDDRVIVKGASVLLLYRCCPCPRAPRRRSRPHQAQARTRRRHHRRRSARHRRPVRVLSSRQQRCPKIQPQASPIRKRVVALSRYRACQEMPSSSWRFCSRWRNEAGRPIAHVDDLAMRAGVSTCWLRCVLY